MQCPSCYNDALSPTEDGRMLCDACGEEFAGFRHEEMDFQAAGTAVSTRESQSSQARLLREKLRARRESLADPSPSQSRPFVNHELVLCEAVILTTNKLAAALVDLRCVSPRIMPPLFELLTHWVARRHCGKTGVVGRGTVFRPTEVLALVALAAVFVRSPMLPRDLCRMVVAEEVPFPGFGVEDLPEHIRKSEVVIALFATRTMPAPGNVVEAANVLARDQHAWPPIRKFFGQAKQEGSGRFRFTGSWDSFPVAHVHVTLLRLSRLLGLPDDFGARVLRFEELRRIASCMCWTASEGRENWWEEQTVDCVVLGGKLEGLRKTIPRVSRTASDLSGFPTDVSLQLDFLNTMRLCYGTPAKNNDMQKKKENLELRKEWEACMEAMENWLRIGNPEDIENVQWALKTPDELSRTKGEEIRKYADMVDNMLTDIGESAPDLWGKYTSAFAEIGDSWQPDSSRKECANAEGTCRYDAMQFESSARVRLGEGRREMDEDCDYDNLTGIRQGRAPLFEATHLHGQTTVLKGKGKNKTRKGLGGNGMLTEDHLDDNAQSSPKTELAGDLVSKRTEDTEELDTLRTSRSDFLKEPVGIGLAWTIMRHFFAGSNVVIGDLQIERLPNFVQSGLLKACNNSMRTVILYVSWLKGRTASGKA